MIFEETPNQQTRTGRNANHKMIKINLVQQAEKISAVAESREHFGQSGFGPKLRHERHKNQNKRKYGRRNIQNVCFPPLVREHCASYRITDTEMQEKRYKKGKRHAVEKIDREIKILSGTDRSICVKNKCGETNGS